MKTVAVLSVFFDGCSVQIVMPDLHTANRILQSWEDGHLKDHLRGTHPDGTRYSIAVSRITGMATNMAQAQ